MTNLIIHRINKYYRKLILDPYHSAKRPSVLNAEYLLSDQYKAYFTRYFEPLPQEHHDAQLSTKDFLYRHKQMNTLLGAWRWKGLYDVRNQIVPIIFDQQKKGLDFGGAASPVANDIEVLDKDPIDIFGRKVKYSDFDQIKEPVDFVFTSHTLEHITPLEEVLTQIHQIIKPGGHLIALVPAYTCTRWRAGIHESRAYTDHKWTFKLSGTTDIEQIEYLKDIDLAIAKSFNILQAQYVGDDSIFILAQKA